MNIFLTELPAKRLLKPSESQFQPDDKVKAIIARIRDRTNTDGRQLIIDGSHNITGMLNDDPINEYYRGVPGDIYRIEDSNAVRYRRVVRGELIRKDVKRIGASQNIASREKLADNYYRAYNTLLQMCQDRGYKYMDNNELIGLRKSIEDIQSILDTQSETLYIYDLTDRNDRKIHIYFMEPANEIIISRKFSEFNKTKINEIIKEIRSKTGDKKTEKIDLDDAANVAKFAQHEEIIIVYNNPANLPSPIKKSYSSNFLQFFSVQQLIFNVTKHVDQPKFTLLHPKNDREELLDLYHLNGMILDQEKPIAHYKVSSETLKLVLI